MNISLPRLILALCLILWLPALRAQSLEIITLHHTTAEQLLPQLRPLVEKGGSISGMNDRILVRASERNRADIRRAVTALDRPLRRLMITVRGEGQGGRDATGGYTYSTRRGSDRGEQQVQTVDGGQAFVQVGSSLPLQLHQVVLSPLGAVVSDTVVFQDLGSGFYAEPRLSGDGVTVRISPSRESAGALPGSVDSVRLSTTVSGRLGEWIPLGGSSAEAERDAQGGVTYSSRRADRRQFWLKVDELP